MREIIKKPKGTKDILPDDQKYWRFVENIVSKRCEAFDFGKITTPIFENFKLFSRAVGEVTDIVEKEMYEVKRLSHSEPEESSDKEKEILVLRPENTAGIVRSYIEKGMQTWPQPVKLYYFGPMYRYDRPQKGRWREFWQFGLEILGDSQPFTDAITILLVWQIFSDFGLDKEDIIIDINSVGCRSCRPQIKKKLIAFLEKYKNMLCADCLKRLDSNPLRILDCKVEQCQKIVKSSPQLIDNLCIDCKNHFQEVLELLDDLDMPYDLNPNLVRGLDYYTRTTFEVRDLQDVTRQSSLGGGGRYDNLAESIGGKPVAGIGFSGGVERIIEKIRDKKIKLPGKIQSEIYIIQLGDKAKKKALGLIRELSEKGLSVSCALGKGSLKSQLKAADKAGARLALIVGQREALDDTIIARDMRDSTQETIASGEVDKIIYKKIKENL